MQVTKMTKARSILICDHPFFASLLLPMPLIKKDGIPSMETDGESIWYSEKWVEELTNREVLFVLAHETLHCVFDHMGRRLGRDPNRWNQAADYIINEILVNDKIGEMPKAGLYNPVLTKRGGNTADGVYKLIPEENEKKKPGEKGAALDHFHDAGTKMGTEPTDAAKMAQASADLKVRVIAAKNTAKMAGKLSAGLERLIEEVLKPQVDWRDALRKFLSERAKVDFSYARPKRRFLAEDLYLPSLTGERMGKLVVAVDCSGSITPRLLDMFSAEINAIKEDLRPSGIDVIYFDSSVCGVETFSSDDDLSLKPHGGGGTAFSPVIKHVNKYDDLPTCMIFLTDLECSDFGKKPEYPVLWCVLESDKSSKLKAPFGKILEVSENENN